MTQLNMDDILGDLIPSPPFIYKKLQEVLNDSDSTFDDLTQVINVDPGLTARLLKIVNSPFYGLSSSVDSIPHAINILGTEQLTDLVLATEVVNKFKGIPKVLLIWMPFGNIASPAA
jgi:HD-like signal output (HDOD) protein